MRHGLTRHRLALVALIAVGTSALAITPLVAARTTVSIRSSQSLYESLSADASRGDLEAARAKEAVDRYLIREGISIRDMPVPDSVKRTMIERGLLDLEVRDAAPWTISVRNRTTIDTLEALVAYRAGRHDALNGLAASGDRLIEVVVTPARLLSLPEFGAHVIGGKPGQVITDAFIGDQWVMSSGMRVTDPRDWDKIETEMRTQMEGSLDQYPGVHAADLGITVRSARLEIPADRALTLLGDPAILLIDPLTDIADDYADKAALVSVGDPPDVFGLYATSALGIQLYPRQYQPTKVEVKP